MCLSAVICANILASSSSVFAETTPLAGMSAVNVTAIPNPVKTGKKLTFRVMAPGPCKVKIYIHNRFFDPILMLQKEGGTFFDILWNPKKLSEGIYYFQANVEDKTTGKVTKLPLQKFAVLK
ncbi:MAG TPA: hypothetical protein VMV05_02515 [bacterium]|nr:hypothetical protein [bacterium]